MYDPPVVTFIDWVVALVDQRYVEKTDVVKLIELPAQSVVGPAGEISGCGVGFTVKINASLTAGQGPVGSADVKVKVKLVILISLAPGE